MLQYQDLYNLVIFYFMSKKKTTHLENRSKTNNDNPQAIDRRTFLLSYLPKIAIGAAAGSLLTSDRNIDQQPILIDNKLEYYHRDRVDTLPSLLLMKSINQKIEFSEMKNRPKKIDNFIVDTKNFLNNLMIDLKFKKPDLISDHPTNKDEFDSPEIRAKILQSKKNFYHSTITNFPEIKNKLSNYLEDKVIPD